MSVRGVMAFRHDRMGRGISAAPGDTWFHGPVDSDGELFFS